MSKIIDAIERAVFGATAQERVDTLNRLIEQKTERHVERLVCEALDRLIAEDAAEDEQSSERSGGDGR